MNNPDKVPVLLGLMFQEGDRVKANMQTEQLTISDGCESSEECQYGSEGPG